MNLIARARPALYTFDDFCALVKDGQKADLIDGVIYMASPDKAGKDLRLACRVPSKQHGRPEPDIGFLKRSRRHLVRRGYVAGRPDAAMEIVSPESIERDYKKKRRQFEEAGVPEYWIIDEMEQLITLLRLGKDGLYHEVPAKNGIFRSKVIRGFWLRPSWLWRKRLPDPLKTLTLIMRKGK
jgi:hypothetical protein